MEFVTILAWITGAVGTFIGGWFLYTFFIGMFFKRKPDYPEAPVDKRIAVLIPACNEESVIENIIHSVQQSNYPTELYDIYTMINNCKDRTPELAKAAGSHVILCPDTIRNKGQAMRYTFDQLLNGPVSYDAFCIFDTDNIIAPDFLLQVNHALHAGVRAAQGYRASIEPFDNSISGCTSLFYSLVNHWMNESHSRLGMSCNMNGTGIMMTADLLRETGYDPHSLTEDVEYTVNCAIHGAKIAWLPKAITFDEQTDNMRQSFSQRRRWTAGSVQCFKRYAKQLLKAHTVQSMDMLFYCFAPYLMPFTSVVIPLLYIVVGLLCPDSPASVVQIVKTISPLNLLLMGLAYLVVMYILIFLGGYVLARQVYVLEKPKKKKVLVTLLRFPFFMLAWFFINITALVPPTKHYQIHHSGKGAAQYAQSASAGEENQK